MDSRSGDNDSDPFASWVGIWREGEGMTIEEIIAEQREMRGWDDYDHLVADGGDPNAFPGPPAPSPLQRTSWPQAPSADLSRRNPASR